MAATSEIQICSNALLLIGSDPISSFSSDAPSAGEILSVNLWPMVRDSVLRSHPWNVATKRVVLAAEVATPPFDWSYSFLLPGDYLRVLSVGRDEDGGLSYQVENGRIYTDEGAVYLRYIFQLTDVTKYDSLLTMAMVAAMAANLAYPITKSKTQQEAMHTLFQQQLRAARSVNGMEDPPEEFLMDSPLIASRG